MKKTFKGILISELVRLDPVAWSLFFNKNTFFLVCVMIFTAPPVMSNCKVGCTL